MRILSSSLFVNWSGLGLGVGFVEFRIRDRIINILQYPSVKRKVINRSYQNICQFFRTSKYSKHLPKYITFKKLRHCPNWLNFEIRNLNRSRTSTQCSLVTPLIQQLAPKIASTVSNSATPNLYSLAHNFFKRKQNHEIGNQRA